MAKKLAPAKLLVIDVLKPHKPDILEFGKEVCRAKSVSSVNISVYAVDEKTESTKIVIEGKDLNFNTIKKIIEDHGAVVHSIDKVSVGKKEVINPPVL